MQEQGATRTEIQHSRGICSSGMARTNCSTLETVHGARQHAAGSSSLRILLCRRHKGHRTQRCRFTTASTVKCLQHAAFAIGIICSHQIGLVPLRVGLGWAIQEGRRTTEENELCHVARGSLDGFKSLIKLPTNHQRAVHCHQLVP